MNVLAVVNEEALAAKVRAVLEPVVDVLWMAPGLDRARALLDQGDVQLVVAVQDLDHGRPTDLLDAVADDGPPLVVLGDGGSLAESEAITQGAVDYLSGDLVEALPHLLRSVAREQNVRERARIAEERLLHANRLIGVGRLAAITAHEVGTPLNVARMQAQLISADRPEDALLQDSCATIVEQIDVASAQMRAMLDFARLGDRGRSPINLLEAVHSAVRMLAPLARRQQVELAVEGPALAVVANRSQVQQVVFNLVTNALHALDGPGHVTLTIAPAERDGRTFGTLTVTDDGPGVPDEVKDQLFDAFVTTKPAGRGTGLGLAVCREIADNHGGWIALRSRPGCTEVEVGLPT